MQTFDLSEVLGRISQMKDNDDAAQAKLASIKKYADTKDVAASPLMKTVKLGAVIDDWMAKAEVQISAVPCWTSLEEHLGRPYAVMSMMSDQLLSSACEVDIGRSAGDACAATGFRHAFCAARLEQ